LFFVAEWTFNTRVREAILEMVDGGIVRVTDRPRLRQAIARALWWRDTWILEAGLFALGVVFIVVGWRADLPGEVNTWRRTPDGRITPAAWWYGVVALPLFQFLVWRWCARLLIWGRLLWTIARLDLHLIPTHPDRAGGLGALGATSLALAPFGFAISAMIVATFAEQIQHARVPVRQFVLPLAATVVGLAALFVAPLWFFSLKLFAARLQGRADYGRLARRYVSEFEAKWIHADAPPTDPLLGSADVQSLADMGSSYAVVQEMLPVPITLKQVLTLVLVVALPLAPLILFVIPLDELILRLARTVLNV
jgi:hypothetical protein